MINSASSSIVPRKNRAKARFCKRLPQVVLVRANPLARYYCSLFHCSQVVLLVSLPPCFPASSSPAILAIHVHDPAIRARIRRHHCHHPTHSPRTRKPRPRSLGTHAHLLLARLPRARQLVSRHRPRL